MLSAGYTEKKYDRWSGAAKQTSNEIWILSELRTEFRGHLTQIGVQLVYVMGRRGGLLKERGLRSYF